MKSFQILELNRAAVREIALRYHMRDIRVFGSDLLVDPTPETTLMDIRAIRYELRKLLGIAVDVLTPNALPDRFLEQVLMKQFRYEQG